MTHSILWRRLDLPGHEFCSLGELGDHALLQGTAVFVHEMTPCRLEYRIRCSGTWQTQSADIRGEIGSRSLKLSISVNEERDWRLNGAACEAVRGCTDIDLGFSPSTNLLPIRRLRLAVGESADVTAAWLPFPSLSFEPLPQKYVREDESTYNYESRGGEFRRTLQVNDYGLVTSYPGLWEMEAQGSDVSIHG